MTRAAVLALVAALPAAAAAAEPGDVPYYVERPAERARVLEWCARDAARQDTRECQNARAAGAAGLMTPNHPWMRGHPFSPPAAPVPVPPAPDPEKRPGHRAT